MQPSARGRPPLPDLQVVPMRRRHLPQVLAIEQLAYPRPWTAGLFHSELAGAGRHYLVGLGERDGPRRRRAVLGYAGAIVQVGEAHVTTVAVDPRQHRRKVASGLLVALMDTVIAAGAQDATLEVRVANRGAQRLYAQFGFVPAGVRPGYYGETGEDALIMWAHDLQTGTYAARLAHQRSRLQLPGGASGAPDLHIPWVSGRIGLSSAGAPRVPVGKAG